MEYNSDKAVDNLYQKQKVFFDNQATKPTAFRIKKLRALLKEIGKGKKTFTKPFTGT